METAGLNLFGRKLAYQITILLTLQPVSTSILQK